MGSICGVANGRPFEQYSHDYPAVQLTLLKLGGLSVVPGLPVHLVQEVSLHPVPPGGITVQLREARRGCHSHRECALEGLVEVEGGVEVLAECISTPTGRTAPQTGSSHCAESNRQ
jgi:hypothetical protein